MRINDDANLDTSQVDDRRGSGGGGGGGGVSVSAAAASPVAGLA